MCNDMNVSARICIWIYENENEDNDKIMIKNVSFVKDGLTELNTMFCKEWIKSFDIIHGDMMRKMNVDMHDPKNDRKVYMICCQSLIVYKLTPWYKLVQS